MHFRGVLSLQTMDTSPQRLKLKGRVLIPEDLDMATTDNARYGTEPTICIPPIIEQSGAGSLAPITPLTMFRSTVGRYGLSPAMAVQRPSRDVFLVIFDLMQF